MEARTRSVEAFFSLDMGIAVNPWTPMCIVKGAILDYLACPTIHLSPAAAQLRISKVIRETIRLVMLLLLAASGCLLAALARAV